MCWGLTAGRLPTRRKLLPRWSMVSRKAYAPHALLPPNSCSIYRGPRRGPKDRRHELDYQLRPPENQLDARPARHAGEPLDQGSRERRDGVSQGSREQSVGNPFVGSPSEDRGARAFAAFLRWRKV